MYRSTSLRLFALVSSLTLPSCLDGTAFAQNKPLAPAATTPAPSKAKEPPPPASRGGVIDLRPKFRVGQVSKFKMNLSSTGRQVSPVSTGGQPNEQTQSMSQELGLSLKVKDLNPETGSTLEMVYDSFKIKMKTPDGQDITFDSTSTKDQDNPFAGVLDSLVGLTLTIRMDKDGNISKVDAGDSALGALGGAGLDALKGFTGADIVKNLFGPVMSTRQGAGEARVGESWVNEDLIDAPWGKMKMTTTQTLSNHRAGIATIDMKGAVALMPNSATAPVPTIRNSLYTGKTLWNTETGMLTEMTVKQQLVLEQADKGTSTQEMDVKVVRVR